MQALKHILGGQLYRVRAAQPMPLASRQVAWIGGNSQDQALITGGVAKINGSYALLPQATNKWPRGAKPRNRTADTWIFSSPNHRTNEQLLSLESSVSVQPSPRKSTRVADCVAD